MLNLRFAIAAAATLGASSVPAAVSLPYVFTHHMVLQRDMPAPVWGKAAPGELVTVRFDGQEKQATADGAGRWRVALDPLALGEPRELVVSGDKSDGAVTVRDVLVGDVWVCSGQSNMQMALQNTRDAEVELAAANRPRIRLLRVQSYGTQEPLDDIDGCWQVCSAESAAKFSAVGYHFGVQVQAVCDVPIGLIGNAWGGAAAESWVPLDRMQADKQFAGYLKSWEKKAAAQDEPKLRADYAVRMEEFLAKRDAAYAAGEPLPNAPWTNHELFGQNRPANLFNARVAPLTPLAIKGAIWYQGETNAWRWNQYDDLFPLLIQSWRDAWGQGDFPFYWVQLADWQPEVPTPIQNSMWPPLREAQTRTLDRLNNVGQAVAIDIGEANDIHPKNKRDVAVRLARVALANTYGKAIDFRGPTMASCDFADGQATVRFEDTNEGLKTTDGAPPVGFAIAGEDKVFHHAVAEVVGKKKDRVRLSAPEVPAPVAVRYAWADNPRVNLYDSSLLPAVPFRTDAWNKPGVAGEAVAKP